VSDATPGVRPPLSEDQRRRVERATQVVDRAVGELQARWGRILGAAEMRSLGNGGLVDAASTFDPELGVPFELFAQHRVRGAILDAVRREAIHRHGAELAARAASSRFQEVQGHEGDVLTDTDDSCRRRLAAFTDGLAASMFAAVVADAMVTVEDALSEHQVREQALRALAEASSSLPERDRTILDLHYRDGRDLKEVAQTLGVGYATIRRWHIALLGRLSVRLRARGVTSAPA